MPRDLTGCNCHDEALAVLSLLVEREPMIDPDVKAKLQALPYIAAIAEHSPAQCPGCHAPIIWCQTDMAVLIPMDMDGEPHRSTCPDALRHRRSKR